jgi:hypothetical protein
MAWERGRRVQRQALFAACPILHSLNFFERAQPSLTPSLAYTACAHNHLLFIDASGSDRPGRAFRSVSAFCPVRRRRQLRVGVLGRARLLHSIPSPCDVHE